jgi:hypothetical protein
MSHPTKPTPQSAISVLPVPLFFTSFRVYQSSTDQYEPRDAMYVLAETLEEVPEAIAAFLAAEGVTRDDLAFDEIRKVSDGPLVIWGWTPK